MIINYKRNWVFLTAWVMVIGFIFRPMFSAKVPVPLDVMVGGYYPWLDQKWGYPVGIPYKNTALTDVFSQLLPWRILAIESLRQGQLPLWNPYSFSGSPLLANWQSASVYPLNILMIIFGNIWGWSLMMVLQVFFAGLFFYLMLRIHRITRTAAFGGGVVFAFSGFMTTYMEYNTTGQIFTWLPLLIIIAKREKYFWYAPWIIFYIVTGGFFQPMLYTLAVAVVYWILNKVTIRQILIYFGLGILMGFIQLLPTAEMLKHSVRNYDPNIVNYDFGLIPGKFLLTFLAPDFFGNPVTGNFFGFMGYQETSGYAGILPIALLLAALSFKTSPLKKTALIFLAVGIVLAFANPISRSVYELKIPFISTGYASRNLLFLSFSLAVLTSMGLLNLKKTRLLPFVIWIALVGIALGYLIVLYFLPPDLDLQYKVSLRNLVIPIAFASAISIVNILRIRSNVKIWLLVGILIIDLVRFTSKFLPFSEARFMELKVPAVEYIKSHVGDFSIERDKGVLPPNSWIYFELKSPSGYDPLLSLEYAKLYSIYQGNKLTQKGFSRYAETENWDSPLLDILGVKYVLTTKKKAGVIDRDGTDAGYKFDKDRYDIVFADTYSLVLENKHVTHNNLRYSDYEVLTGDEAFKAMEANDGLKEKIIIDEKPHYDPEFQDIMLLNKAYYPGWKAYIDGKETKIYKAFGALQAVVVPKEKAELKFTYLPGSFVGGAVLTFSTILVLGIMKWLQVQNG